MRLKAPLLAALALCVPFAALADTVSIVPRTGVIYQNATVTSASGQVISAALMGTYQYIQLINPNTLGSGNIWCLFGGAGVAAAGGTHGEIPIAPFQSYAWETSSIPTGALNCISDQPSVNFTYGVK